MFDERTSLSGASGRGRCGGRASAASLVVGIAILLGPGWMLAQHGGGGGGGRGMGGGAGAPYGVSTKDDLKDFHRLVALEATAEQKSIFGGAVQDAQTASEQVKGLVEGLKKEPPSKQFSDAAVSLGQAIAKARSSNQNFLASFSQAQKSGLKDLTRKLLKTDSDLAKQSQDLVETTGSDNAHASNATADLDKTLASFESGQLALGDEMSIILPSAAAGLTFTLPPMTSSFDVAGRRVAIPTSGTVSRTSAGDGRSFSLRLTADLSDVQQEISGLLQSQLNRAPRCGERLEVQRATLTPLGTASLVRTQLHYERWICAPGQGSGSASELASGDGTIELKLIPSVEQNTRLHLVSEMGRIDADGLLRELLSSGALGLMLRDRIAGSLLSLMQNSADLESALPPVAHGLATLMNAQFQDEGAGRLSLVLDGQLQFSDEQAKQFAAQLKQRLSAQTLPH
jgi:hypothetical protein